MFILILARHLKTFCLIFISCNEHYTVILHLHIPKCLSGGEIAYSTVHYISTVLEIQMIKTQSTYYNLYSWGNKKNIPYIVFIKKAIIFCVSNKGNGYCYSQFASNYF